MQNMASTVPEKLCVAVPETAFTSAGFRAWLESDEFPEVGRIDLCDGEVLVDMSPERAQSHTLVKGEIYRVLAGLVRERNLGRIYVDGVRFRNDRAGINTEPDGLFVSFEMIAEGKVHGGLEHDEPLGVAGEADWILEVVSPSSEHKDRRRLLPKYAEAGVREYWIVDARGAEMDVEIYVLGPDFYRLQPLVDGWRRSEAYGEDFRLERNEDAAGGWQFTLLVR